MDRTTHHHHRRHHPHRPHPHPQRPTDQSTRTYTRNTTTAAHPPTEQTHAGVDQPTRPLPARPPVTQPTPHPPTGQTHAGVDGPQHGSRRNGYPCGSGESRRRYGLCRQAGEQWRTSARPEVTSTPQPAHGFPEPCPPLRIRVRDMAVDAVLRALELPAAQTLPERSLRTQVVMATGSGKSLVVTRSAEELHSSRVLVLVPSMDLLARTRLMAGRAGVRLLRHRIVLIAYLRRRHADRPTMPTAVISAPESCQSHPHEYADTWPRCAAPRGRAVLPPSVRRPRLRTGRAVRSRRGRRGPPG
ncbi:DEAD/DEAH box helicase family protein [Streptomyces sp. NPDC057939]|uniref:DEAD/DEAH box helicase family protein n=1 Tax=Streptomyces sp. NPDC057939 TaxID=3346284 RepID=UPI0036E61408